MYIRSSISTINYKIERIYDIINNINPEIRKSIYKFSLGEYRKNRTPLYRTAYKLWNNPYYVIVNGLYILRNNNIIVSDQEFDLNNDSNILENITKIKTYILAKSSSLDKLLSIIIYQLYFIKS